MFLTDEKASVCGFVSFSLLIVLKSDKEDELIFSLFVFAITSGISRFHASLS